MCRQSMPECSANATGKAAPLLGAAPLPGAAPFCQVQPMAGPLAAAGGSLCGASHCHALERRPPLELKAQLEAGALLATHNPLVRLAAAGKRERGAAGAAGAKCVRGSSSRHWHAVGRARAISPPLPNSAPACPSLPALSPALSPAHLQDESSTRVTSTPPWLWRSWPSSWSSCSCTKASDSERSSNVPAGTFKVNAS